MAYQGEGNIDPMGLGGVGGGFFGGDIHGSGGSKLTGLGIKDGVETTPKEEQAFWDSIRTTVVRAKTQPLSFWANNVFDLHQIGKTELALKGLKTNKKGKFGTWTLLSFFSDKEEAKENLQDVFATLTKDKNFQNLSAVQKGLVVDSFVSSLATAWGDSMHAPAINEALAEVIEGPKGFKTTNNIPSMYKGVIENSIYDRTLYDPDFIKDDDIDNTNAKIRNYLDTEQIAAVAPPPPVVEDETTKQALKAYEDNPPLSTQEVFDDIENMLNQPTIQQAPPPTGQAVPSGQLAQTTVDAPEGLIGTAQNANIPTNTTADLSNLSLAYDFDTDPTFGANITA